MQFDNPSLAPYESNDPRDYTWLHFPKAQVPALVTEYIAELVTSPTNKYCTCEWIVHRDDVDLPPGVKRRVRKGQTSWDCWIHTKEGMILGFFTWVFRKPDPAPEREIDPNATMEITPEVRKRVELLQAMIEDENYSYEEVMAFMQESSQPTSPEQKQEWEDAPEKQAAVAHWLKDKFIEQTKPRITIVGNADQMMQAAKYLEKDQNECVCPVEPCPLHTGKIIEIQE